MLRFFCLCLRYFLSSRACLLEEGSKQSSIISEDNAFYLILNKDFFPAVFGLSNVSGNPGLNFLHASTWEVRRFSGQLCHVALSTVVASSKQHVPYRALISSFCDCCTNVLTFLMTSITFSFLNCCFFFLTKWVDSMPFW